MYSDFDKWEKSFEQDSLPELPPDEFEKIIENHTDPIACAKAMHEFMDGMPPEAQETYVKKGVGLINYYYTAQFLNSLVQVYMEGDFGTPHLDYIASDMDGVLKTLRQNGRARAGGYMGGYEKHYFTDESTNITRPIISLRMFNAAFEDENGQKVDHDNFLTVPVTAIADYRILDIY